MCAWSCLLCTFVLLASATTLPQSPPNYGRPMGGPPSRPPSRPPGKGPFRAQAVPIPRQPPRPPSASRPTVVTVVTPSGNAQSRVAHPYPGPPSRPPSFPNQQIGNGASSFNYNQISDVSSSFKLSPSQQPVPYIPSQPSATYQPQQYPPKYVTALNSVNPTSHHYTPAYHRMPSHHSYAPHHHYHDSGLHYHSHPPHSYHGHHGSHHHHHGHHNYRAPNELLELMSPLKKEDAMFPSSSNHPGSLYGIMVPLMLLGISIPAIGFVYTYFSRRSLDSGFVHNIAVPSKEDMDYYVNMLQRGIACFQNPNECSM